MRDDLPTGAVTFLFTDVEGSTRLLHELGAEAYADALAEHRRIVRDACATEGGVEVDTQGDAFFFAFPSASGAVTAAQAMTDALAVGPIQLRIGLHTGAALVTDEGYVGDDVHLAARVAASGHGGQVVVSQSTRVLLDGPSLTDLGEHRLKDVDGAISIFQVGDESFPPLKTISNTNLPRPASSFVGREQELDEVLALFEGARLVTLTGPGGSGKTRLALEAASTLVPKYKAGVFWFGLAALRDPALVMETVAQTLGAKDSLAEHIGEREFLLLLDNLEQVIEAASDLSSLLQACPNLTLLVTSRELLRVQGEVEYEVPPLREPEAVSLFHERSQLEPSDEISELCRRLDSLPLAVELAAARTKALSPKKILARLSQRLDMLKGGRDADPRQQTLRATIEWSYDLLSEKEQRLFRALSVFSGGCTLEAAEEVTDADVDTVQSLVEKSLLRGTDERYWMLETIREYAGERLQVHGNAAPLLLCHAEWCCDLAERMGGMPPKRRLREDFGTLPDEVDNVRSALAWAWKSGNDELALRFGPACLRYWMDRALFHEATAWLEQSPLMNANVPPRVRLDALRAAGVIAFMILADTDLAEERWSQALSLAHELPDTEEIVFWIQRMRAGGAWDRGDLEVALSLLEQNLAETRKRGSRTQEADFLFALAALLGNLERFEEAEDVCLQAAEVHLELGDHVAVATLQVLRGDFALGRGEISKAAELYYQYLEALDRLGGGPHGDRDVAYGLAGLASVLAERGRDEDAAQVWGAVCAAEEALGFRIIAAERRRYERRLVRLEASDSWIEGRKLTLADAADLLGGRLRPLALE
jgi:predicted ATPase/class 3 adenylate cyclase